MAALTGNRNTQKVGALDFAAVYPLAASTTIYLGGMVMLNSSGNALPAGIAADTIVGVASLAYPNGVNGGPGVYGNPASNASGAAGAVAVEVRRGVYMMDNAGSNPVVAATSGLLCYAIDDHTVCNTSNSGANPCAGTVVGIDPVTSQVIVDFTRQSTQAA